MLVLQVTNAGVKRLGYEARLVAIYYVHWRNKCGKVKHLFHEFHPHTYGGTSANGHI